MLKLSDRATSSAITCTKRVTSSLPDHLTRLEIKLDGLTKEALVLKSLSLDSGSTYELTSKAVLCSNKRAY